MHAQPANLKLRRSLTCLLAGSLAFLLLVGGQWSVLQSIAWVRMIVAFSQQDSLLTALRKTFDGRHPCALCRQVREGRQQEQQNSQRAPREEPERMLELFCGTDTVTLPLPCEGRVAFATFPLDRYSEFVESPPTPPPRLGVAVL